MRDKANSKFQKFKEKYKAYKKSKAHKIVSCVILCCIAAVLLVGGIMIQCTSCSDNSAKADTYDGYEITIDFYRFYIPYPVSSTYELPLTGSPTSHNFSTARGTLSDDEDFFRCVQIDVYSVDSNLNYRFCKSFPLIIPISGTFTENEFLTDSNGNYLYYHYGASSSLNYAVCLADEDEILYINDDPSGEHHVLYSPSLTITSDENITDFAFRVIDTFSGCSLSWDDNFIFPYTVNSTATWFDYNPASEYSQGYQSGYNSGSSTAQTDSYNTGYTAGNLQGYSQGHSAGYNTGYTAGVSVGEAGTYNFKTLLFGIIDAPVAVLRDTFDFEIFGINVSSLILFLLTGVIVMFVVKKLIL